MSESKIILNPKGQRLKEKDGQHFIWCQIRKRWMVWTPEELVRQSLLDYMIHDRKYWPSHIAVEKQITTADTKRRYDILVADKTMNTQLVVECKAPNIDINENSIKQLLRYNLHLKARYLVLSNGQSSWVFDSENSEWLDDLPKLHLGN